MDEETTKDALRKQQESIQRLVDDSKNGVDVDKALAEHLSEKTKNTVCIQRVSYGKESTPVEDREYVLVGTTGPVGTIQEFIDAGFNPIVQEGSN